MPLNSDKSSLAGIDEKKIKLLINRIKSGIDPKQSYTALGNEMLRAGRVDESIRYFGHANSIEEDYLSLYNIGSAYYKKGEYKNALFNLEKSRLMNSSFTMSSLLAGLSYSHMDNIKAAESNFINVLMNDPLNRVALTALSILYYNQGRMTDSLKLAEMITSKFKSSEKIKELKYEILLKSDISEDPARELKNIKKNSENFRLYDRYIESVRTDIFNDKYGTINDKIKNLEDDEEEDSRKMISLSLCHLFKGDTDSAIDCLFKARQLSAV